MTALRTITVKEIKIYNFQSHLFNIAGEKNIDIL